jgi:hypothetical protein
VSSGVDVRAEQSSTASLHSTRGHTSPTGVIAVYANLARAFASHMSKFAFVVAYQTLGGSTNLVSNRFLSIFTNTHTHSHTLSPPYPLRPTNLTTTATATATMTTNMTK